MNVDLWAIQPGDQDKADLVERAARVCYRSSMAETRGQQHRFLASLSERGHLSVFEHARYVWVYHSKDPYRHYWPIRYGTNITIRDPDYYFVSTNARHGVEMYSVNPVLVSIDMQLVSYDTLTDDEKLAHASATFCISGISRACSHQLVRHRTMSFSQRSQRYCDSGEWEAVVPPAIEDLRATLRHFNLSMQDMKNAYSTLRERGIAKQDARFVLPNATPTTIVATATFEHWLHFLELRCNEAAQWEIREVANEILRQLHEVEPSLFPARGHSDTT